MTPNTMKSVIDRVINGEDNRNATAPIPLLTSSRVRTAFPETTHDSETKRNSSSMDESRHTKQKFKMPVSAMNAACSICFKTSQSGVGGICKGCWTQFQQKGVRIGNIEEFKEFTESVKNNVSKIVTGKDDIASSNSQTPVVDSLRDIIPNIFFKDKHRRSIEPPASKSLSVETTDSATKKNTPKFSGAISGESDTSCSQSKSIESARVEAVDHPPSAHKSNTKIQNISRGKTFVDPTRNNPPETDSKSKLNEKVNADTSRYMDRKVTRTKTEFSMKGYNDRSQKSTVSGEPKQSDSGAQSAVLENRDKSNDNVTANVSKVKRTETEHIDSWKIEKNSRKIINEKQKYEPTTVRESSKLSHSQTKVDGQINREKRPDSRYGKRYDPIVNKKSNVKTNNRPQYDNTIKLGTRSMKGNALRQMAGNNGNKSSTDEDDDSDSKSGRIKDTYKPLNDIKVSSQNNMINTFKDRLPKKSNPKEIKYTKSTISSVDVQNKYSAYSQVNSEKLEDKKSSSSNDVQKTNDSIYFSQRGLVATVSNFINKNECFKNPKDGQSLTPFQQGAKELYYSTDASDMPRKDETPAIENYVPKKVNNFYFEDKPSSNSVSDDYTAYKHGMNPAAANYKAIESGDSSYHKSSTQQNQYYTDGKTSYSSTYTVAESNHGDYSQIKSGNIKRSEEDYYTGGFNGKRIEFENSEQSYTAPFATKSKGYIDWVDKAGSSTAGESYSGSGSSSMINSSSGNEMYTGSSYEVTGLNQKMIQPIFHRPAEATEPILPICDRPTLVPSLESEAKESSVEKGPTTQKSSRMFRKRNKIMDEMIGQNIDSAGEFFSKAIVSFKNPFNNFNSNSNLWYGKERNAIAGAFQDNMSFEKPNYTDWDPDIKPIFQKPAPKTTKEPLVLDFLKYEKETDDSDGRHYRDIEDTQTDDWYAGTEEGFHGPVNTTWDGKNWKNDRSNKQRSEDDDDDDDDEDDEKDYTDEKHCRICPNNNNSTNLICNINNNYPDYDKYDKPVVIPKKIAKQEIMGNDRDYAPCLYSVPDRYVSKQTPSPVNFRPPQSPPHQKKYSLESSYFFAPQSNCDEEPEYAGYERKREREIPKEPSPPPVPQVIKVGSILVRNNVENDFDYAENVNRDLNDESFGAMGFNQRSQELNSMPFPHATAATLMTEQGNLKQIIDVQQAIRRDWTNSKTPAESLPSHLPSRSAPMKIDGPHQMEHEEPVKKSSKHPKTRTTSVTSDAVHRRGGSKETSSDLEPIKKPTVPRMQSSSNSNSIKKPITPRVATTTQKKQYTPRIQSNMVERSRTQTPRQLNYTSDLKKKEKNKDRQQQGLLWKVVSKPLKVCGIIREQK